MASEIAVYHRYNRPSFEGLICGESMTQSEHARSCDINVIMEKYTRTGTVPTRTDMGKYGDFSDEVDFMYAQNVIAKSKEQFGALSAKVRERFGNDPGKFLGWVHDKSRTADDFAAVGMDMSEEFKARKAEAAKAAPPSETVKTG